MRGEFSSSKYELYYMLYIDTYKKLYGRKIEETYFSKSHFKFQGMQQLKVRNIEMFSFVR
jgi:hypothetical protein